MKLRNNIIILCTLFLCVGIFISDQSSNQFPFLFFILNLIFFFLGFYFLKIKIKKTLSVLFFTSTIFLIIGFTLHHFSKIQVTKGKKHLNKVIECKAIVESSSFTNAGNVKLQLKTFFLARNNKTYNEEIKFLAYLKNKKIKVNQKDTIYLKSELKSFESHNNPWEFDFGKFNERKSVIGYVFLNDENYSLKKGEFYFLDNNSIRSKLNYLLGSVLSGQELEVCKAFLWGEREGVSDEVLDAFSNTGTIHILAVSGLHVGILFAIIIHICKFFSRWINKKQATIISILIAWFYAYITGFSPSILRSVIVFSLIFYNDITEKRRNELMLMALSAMSLLVYDTNYLFDLGFQLTYAALIGIYVFYPYFKNIYKVKNKVVDYFYSPMMLGFSAQLTTLPIILFNFHQFPNYFTVTNLLLVPFSFLIISLGLAFYVFSFSSFLKIIFGKALFCVVHFMIYIVAFFDDLPFSVAKQFDFNSIDFLIYTCILIYLFIILKMRNKKQLVVFCFVSISFCGYIQFKRFKSIDNSCLARVGNSNVVISKNNTNVYYFVDSKFKKNGEINRVEKYYQSNFELIDLKSNQNLTVNKHRVPSFSFYQNDNKFQILKKW